VRGARELIKRCSRSRALGRLFSLGVPLARHEVGERRAPRFARRLL